MRKDDIYIVKGRNVTGHGFEKGSIVLGTGESTTKGFWCIGLFKAVQIKQILKSHNLEKIGEL